MDLIQIAGTTWRHKWVTIPIVLLTIVVLGYVVAFKPMQYTAQSGYMLIPPVATAPAQTTGNAASGNAKNNPFVRFGDLSVIVDMLTQQLNANPVHDQLVREGADPSFSVTDDIDYSPAPVLQVTGTGSSAASAVASANVVGRGAINLLNKLQVEQHVDPQYRITMLTLQTPQPTLKASSLVRSAVAVIAVGGILLVVALSVASGIEDLRRGRKTSRAPQVREGAELHSGGRLTTTGGVSARLQGHPETREIPDVIERRI